MFSILAALAFECFVGFTVCGVVVFEEGAEIGKRKMPFDIFRLRCQAKPKRIIEHGRVIKLEWDGDENEWGQYTVDDAG